MPTKRANHEGLLLEVGWEVCSQLGGIYTVLRTKAQTMVSDWGNRYCLIGPYNPVTAAIEFQEEERTGPLGRACDLLEKKHGIRAHFGRWLANGEPQVILLDFQAYRARLSEFKYFMWKDHDIQPGNEPDVENCVLFGFALADFLEVLCKAVRDSEFASQPVLAHFHEWMASVAIPIILKRELPISTIFTTHATILGRYLASTDRNFYNRLPWINPWDEAKRLNIIPQFAIERAAAWGATCFTTISDITATEATQLLGRQPDILLPNGLHTKRFAAVHEFQNLHLTYKRRIQEFLMGHFFPNYTFDLNKTLHIFCSGRYEYHNKGIDLFIESLARLNWRLKSERKDVTVVAFIITRAATRGFNVHVLKNQMLFKEMRNYCETVSSGVASKLLTAASTGKDPRNFDLFDEHELHTLKRLRQAWKQTHPLPNVVTHSLEYEAEDPILNQLKACRLLNLQEDSVKVVYHPDFLTAASPILGLDYEQFVRGCHLGVFPSYYEPWGYTPEECAALGIPSITSDLSGFGTFVRQKIQNHAERGLTVIGRRFNDFNDSANQLTNAIHGFVTMGMRDRIELRNRVEAISSKFDWKELIPNYRWAHRIAIARGRRQWKKKLVA